MNFDQHIYDIPIEKNSDDVDIDGLKESIRLSWNANIRKNINKIKESNNHEYTVDIIFDKRIPLGNGSFSQLLKYGWSFFDYEKNKLSICPIEYDPKFNEFYLKQRKEKVRNNEMIITDLDLELDFEDENKKHNDKINEIKSIITDSWNIDTLNRVNSIYKPENEDDVYCISFDNNIKISNNNICTVPTKKYINALVQNNWGVISIKTNNLYIAEIRKVISENTDFAFKLKNDEYNKIKPYKCDICSKNEGLEKYIIYRDNENEDENKTEFKFLCDDCSNI